LLINVYMPCSQSSTNHDALYSVLAKVQSELDNCRYNYIVWGGDWNCNVLQQTGLSQIINQFMNDLNLTVCNSFLGNNFSVDYTFDAETRQAYSAIDHFFASNMNPNYICACT